MNTSTNSLKVDFTIFDFAHNSLALPPELTNVVLAPKESRKVALTTLPKDISIDVRPDEDGGFTAAIAGIPSATARGETMEEAEARVMEVFGELMLARRELAAKKCRR